MNETQARRRTDKTSKVGTSSISSLPEIGGRWPGVNGAKYYGIRTDKDGALYVLAVLDAKAAGKLNHDDAVTWTRSVGGDLPTPAEAAHLVEVTGGLLGHNWVWTSKKHGSSGAWRCGSDGDQHIFSRSAEGGAVAVRRLPLGSFDPLEGAAKATAARVDELRAAAQALLAACNDVGGSL